MTEKSSREQLSAVLRAASELGLKYSVIAEETGVNRASISILANKPEESTLSGSRLEALTRWADAWTRGQETDGSYKTEMELIQTGSYQEGLGMCRFAQTHRGFLVITGMPGTGKTTLAQTVETLSRRVIYLEAWPMMRMGDLIRMLGEGMQLRLTGTQLERIQQIERALRGTDTTIIIDEAEMLHKWDNDKLEVIRKIWDHTGITMILMGTPKLLDVVSKMDTTQLSRRMWNMALKGAEKREILDALQGYNMDREAMEQLAAIAADQRHGGMGSFAMTLKLCLSIANGGRITRELLDDARSYKPGLGGSAA